MQAKEVIKAMVKDSGIAQATISLSMGRGKDYIASYVSRARIPSIEIMAEMADSAGFDLILRNRNTGNEIQVDPPDNLPSQKE